MAGNIISIVSFSKFDPIKYQKVDWEHVRKNIRLNTSWIDLYNMKSQPGRQSIPSGIRNDYFLCALEYERQLELKNNDFYDDF